MKKHASILMSIVFLLVLLMLVGMIEVVQASAAGSVLQPTPTPVSPPPPGLAVDDASAWYDGIINGLLS